MKTFKVDENAKSGRFYRVMNEVPTLLFVFVVILVIIRPF
jgi:putative membrane protein